MLETVVECKDIVVTEEVVADVVLALVVFMLVEVDVDELLLVVDVLVVVLPIAGVNSSIGLISRFMLPLIAYDVPFHV